MADNQEKILAEFESRVDQLIALCSLLKRQNAALNEELERKTKTIESLSIEVAHVKKQYDDLRFARAFSMRNREEVQKAKQRLTKLVRDVDKCIALLKD